jgi:hypothetical protein
VDLGLDRLIEMIEQRVGKPAATAVLYAVTAGAFAWGIHALFAYLILPVATHGADVLSYVRSATPRQLTEVWAQAVIGGALGLLVFLAGLKVIEKRFKRKANEITGALRGQLIDARSILSDCRTFTTENHRGLQEASAKLKQDMECAKEALVILKALERADAAENPPARTPSNSSAAKAAIKN